MLSLTKCSDILNSSRIEFNEAEVKLIRDFLYKIGGLGYELFNKLNINIMKIAISYIQNDNEAKLILQYCNQNNIRIEHSFHEVSSRRGIQSEWKNLIKFIQTGKPITCIVITKWDKISTNPQKAWNEIKSIRSTGIEIVCINQPVKLNGVFAYGLLCGYIMCSELEYEDFIEP